MSGVCASIRGNADASAHKDGPPRPAGREEGEEGDGLQELGGLVHDDDGDAAQAMVVAVVGERGYWCVCMRV